MKFKDIIERETYDYHENATVEILVPNENKDTELYPYAFVIDGTTLITMKENTNGNHRTRPIL